MTANRTAAHDRHPAFPLDSPCMECGEQDGIQWHHVIPRSMGGTVTVPLCPVCHGKAHDRRAMAHNALTSRAMKARMADGHYIGGKVPYGFRREGNRLIECPREQKTIAEAKRLRSEGLSLRAIAADLAARGMMSRGGGPFQPCAINTMVAA
jgi:hypothetical protein